MADDDAKTFHYTVENRGDYLYVKVEGQLRNREQLVQYQSAIVGGMTPELNNHVMIDGRDADRPLQEMRAEMWTWMTVTPVLRRVAIIANNPRTTKRVERTANLNRIVASGFHTIEEAEAWLRKGV